MKLGVVIVTYNRINLLKECIEACLKQTCKFSSIIIVNNCSTDGTKEYLDSIDNKEINIINLDKNIGGAGGFYEGIKYASEDNKIDYLLVIDDDAIIEKNFNKKILTMIKNSIDNKEEIFAFSGTVVTDGEILTSTRKNIGKKYSFEKCDVEQYKKEFFDYEVSSFCGLYISIDIIKKVGFPKKDFFIWYDDTEYCMRINKLTKFRNVNNAIVDHKAPIDKSNPVSWKSYYGNRNRLYVEKKYFPKRIYIKHVIKNLLKSVKEYITYIFRRNKKNKYLSKIYFYSTFDFIRNKYGINEKIGFLTFR